MGVKMELGGGGGGGCRCEDGGRREGVGVKIEGGGRVWV